MSGAVVVTGIGIVSAFTDPVEFSNDCEFSSSENSAQRLFEKLCAGATAVRPHALSEIPWPCAWIDFRASQHFSKMQLLGLDRSSQFAIVAAKRALAHAALSNTDVAGEQTGVYFGTGAGGAESTELAHAQYYASSWQYQNRGQLPNKKPLTIPAAMTHASAAQVGIALGVQGQCITYSTACSSSAVALGEAFHKLKHAPAQQGVMQYALVGGAEAMLQPGMLHNWSELRVLTKHHCIPFCTGRDGFAMGEGAVFMVLELESHARRRQAPVLAEIVGYGQSNDALHITKPDAAGQARAMSAALADAQLAPEQIDMISAHGTGTLTGDVVEAQSMQQVFAQHLQAIPISATKAATGHWVGAAGILEAAISILSLQQNLIPGIPYVASKDPEIDADIVIGKTRRTTRMRHAMSNSFAFGGNNVSLVFSTTEGMGA